MPSRLWERPILVESILARPLPLLPLWTDGRRGPSRAAGFFRLRIAAPSLAVLSETGEVGGSTGNEDVERAEVNNGGRGTGLPYQSVNWSYFLFRRIGFRATKPVQIAGKQLLLGGVQLGLAAHFAHPRLPLVVRVLAGVVELVTAGALVDIELDRLTCFFRRKLAVGRWHACCECVGAMGERTRALTADQRQSCE